MSYRYHFSVSRHIVITRVVWVRVAPHVHVDFYLILPMNGQLTVGGRQVAVGDNPSIDSAILNNLTSSRLKSAGVGDNKAFPVDKVKLDSFSWNSFVANRVFFKDIINLLLLVLETNHIHLTILTLYLYSDFLHLIHCLVNTVIKPLQLLLLNQSLNHSLPLALVVHHKVNSTRTLNIIYMLNHRINLVKLYVQKDLFVHKVYTQQDELNSTTRLTRLCHKGLGHMINILSLSKDNHQQIRLFVIDLKQLFLGSKKNIPCLVKISLIAEIKVSHIVPSIEDVLIKQVSEHVLLPLQPKIVHIQQYSLIINPSFPVVSQPNPLMLVELTPQEGHPCLIAEVEQNDTRSLLLLQMPHQVPLIGVVNLRQVRKLMHHNSRFSRNNLLV